ncbi:MAG TPA: VWA domain-containing protein [Thioploca sp.]|nr:VWA domain-containing protein [Thioploca sp.]
MKTRNFFYSASRRTAVVGCTLLAASWNLAWSQADPATTADSPSEPKVPSCSNLTDYLNCSSEGRQEDVVFVFDTTGSMGDEITEMQSAVIEFSETIGSSGIDYRLGLTEYKDFPTDPCGDPEDMPYKVYKANESETLTADKVEMQGWIKSLKPSGGNDTPESILAALAHTVKDQTWRPKANRMAVVITDAPAHKDGNECNQESNTLEGPNGVIAQLRKQGVVTHIIGPDDNALRSIATKTGGKFFEIRKTQSITDILGKIAELINCSYLIRSGFSFTTGENKLNMEIRLIGAQNKTIPHIDGQSSLTVFACGGAKGTKDDCAEFELTPETTEGETVYKHTAEVSAFVDATKLTDISTLVKVCDFSKTTTKRPMHIGKCEADNTPKPDAPELKVDVTGNNVRVSWNTVTYANKFTLFYAPYSNPIGEATTKHIKSMDMAVQTGLNVTLPTGTHYYVAVQASDCSGSSGFSNLGVVEVK